MPEHYKGNIIKFTWRRNLIYPIQMMIWTFLRRIDTFILDKVYSFSKSELFTFLMFLGEFFSGIILYIYQKRSLKKKNAIKMPNASTIFINKTKKIKNIDSMFKILLLIFFISYFDFIQFILYTYYIPKNPYSSSSLESRLGGVLTIISALLCYYILKIPIYKHQIFSVVIIAICLVIIIVSEFYFQDINVFITYKDFGITILLIFFVHFFNTFFDTTEKYIIEYNYIHHFIILSLQGLFGFIITFVYSYFNNSYIEELKNIYLECSQVEFAFYIILLFIYFIICGGRNVFRIITNKLYSPMTISLIDYFLNPIYFLVNYLEGDFVSGGEQNFFYFLINLIISIIIFFCGCIYNEIFIIFLFGLEKDTHDQVVFRSLRNYSKDFKEMKLFINDDDDNEINNIPLGGENLKELEQVNITLDGYIIKGFM